MRSSILGCAILVTLGVPGLSPVQVGATELKSVVLCHKGSAYPSPSTVYFRVFVEADLGGCTAWYTDQDMPNPGDWLQAYIPFPSNCPTSYFEETDSPLSPWPHQENWFWKWRHLSDTTLTTYGRTIDADACNGDRTYIASDGVVNTNWYFGHGLTEGVHYFRLKVTWVGNDEEQYYKRVACPSFIDFVGWATGYLNVPYEVGGMWFGGMTGTCKGGDGGDQGYGIDCSSLVSAAARWALYHWECCQGGECDARCGATRPISGWRYSTKSGSLCMLGQVIREITWAEAGEGDVIFRQDHHVYIVEARDAGTFHLISAEGKPEDRVLRRDKTQQSLQGEGYIPCRLMDYNTNPACPPP